MVLVIGHPFQSLETIPMDRHGPEIVGRDLVPGPVEHVRARASEMLWAVLDGTALAPGAAFFPALVNHLAAALGVHYVFVAECTDETHTRVRTLAFWSRDTLADNIEFDLGRHALRSGDRRAGQLSHS